MAASPRAALPAPGPRGGSPGEAPARSAPLRSEGRPRAGGPRLRGEERPRTAGTPRRRHRAGSHDAPPGPGAPRGSPHAPPQRSGGGGEGGAQIGEARLPPPPIPRRQRGPLRPPTRRGISPPGRPRHFRGAHTRARPRSLAHTHGARFPPEPTARPGPRRGGGGGEAERRSHGPAAPQVTEGRGEGGSAAPRAPAPLTRRALGAPGALIVAFIPGGFRLFRRASERKESGKGGGRERKRKNIKEKTPRASPFPRPPPLFGRGRPGGGRAQRRVAIPGCAPLASPRPSPPPPSVTATSGLGGGDPPAPTKKELRESWTEGRAPLRSATLATRPGCPPHVTPRGRSRLSALRSPRGRPGSALPAPAAAARRAGEAPPHPSGTLGDIDHGRLHFA